MILTRWIARCRRLPATEVQAGFEAHPDETLLFAFTTDRMVVDEHAGEFSLKIVTHGAERYRLGRREVILQPGQILLTNRGQSYSSSIDRPRTRAISCFLPSSVIEGVRGRMDGWAGGPSRSTSLEAPQVAFRPGWRLAPKLARLVAGLDAIAPPPLEELEELIHEVGCLALAEARGLVLPGAFPARMRRTTRDELVARVLRARELAEDTAGRVSLGRMADEAGLSRFHLIRVFRAVCGTTPVAYARGIRLARGVARLRSGEPPRTAARAAGFGSASAFLRSLRRN